jgi:acetyl-CoA carboxylase biotin carboxyl carrier protein
MMDGNKLNELRELVEFLKANEIAEFDMEQLSRLMASAPAAAPAPVTAAAPTALTAAAPAAEAEEKLHEVKSPIVGTFYESPSPGAPAFVKVGDQVEVGQVLCIVEAMKLMNEIESDVAGEVVKRIASSGQPVEYGQALFAIKAR